MDTTSLEALGLTKSEIAVYVALLDLGQSTTGPLIKKSGIASGKAYLILDKLMAKGLVTHTITSGKKLFQAKNPNRLLVYLNEKKRELDVVEKDIQKLLPVLTTKFVENKKETKAEVYEGFQGMRTFHQFMLDECKKGDLIYVFGAPKEANEKFGAFFIEWNEQRVKRGIKLRILYSYDSRSYGEQRKKLPLTEVRYLQKDEQTLAWVDVFSDYVVTIHVHGEPVCFLIKDEVAKDSYLKYFETIWERSED